MYIYSFDSIVSKGSSLPPGRCVDRKTLTEGPEQATSMEIVGAVAPKIRKSSAKAILTTLHPFLDSGDSNMD
jgi:hypothetical protein